MTTLNGFKCFPRNRVNTSGGGVATFIKVKDKFNTIELFKGKGDNEVIITRHGQFTPAINVINFYGPQESRTSFNTISENWEVILNQNISIQS